MEEVGKRQVELMLYRPDTGHNEGHFGMMVLSASRQIMNEVFALASELGIPIYYTDTDSFVTDFDKQELLQEKFKEKYGRNLYGKELGEFHSDFEKKNFPKHLAVKDEEVYSTNFYPMAKKLYLHTLEEERDGKL